MQPQIKTRIFFSNLITRDEAVQNEAYFTAISMGNSQSYLRPINLVGRWYSKLLRLIRACRSIFKIFHHLNMCVDGLSSRLSTFSWLRHLGLDNDVGDDQWLNFFVVDVGFTVDDWVEIYFWRLNHKKYPTSSVVTCNLLNLHFAHVTIAVEKCSLFVAFDDSFSLIFRLKKANLPEVEVLIWIGGMSEL